MYLNGLTHRRVSASAGGAGKKSTRGSVIFGEARSAQSWRRPWAAWRLTTVSKDLGVSADRTPRDRKKIPR